MINNKHRELSFSEYFSSIFTGGRSLITKVGRGRLTIETIDESYGSKSGLPNSELRRMIQERYARPYGSFFLKEIVDLLCACTFCKLTSQRVINPKTDQEKNDLINKSWLGRSLAAQTMDGVQSLKDLKDKIIQGGFTNTTEDYEQFVDNVQFLEKHSAWSLTKTISLAFQLMACGLAVYAIFYDVSRNQVLMDLLYAALSFGVSFLLKAWDQYAFSCQLVAKVNAFAQEIEKMPAVDPKKIQ